MEKLLRENPIIAIMRNIPDNIATDYIDCISAGGIKCFEIALNSPNAFQQIELARKHCSQDIMIGAGTVLNAEQARRALDAGASFLLSPSVNSEVLDYCSRKKVRLLPGVMSPTDVSICLLYGFHILKLFPAAELPPNYIKSLKGPFQNTEYVAVGGVDTRNLVQFFQNGFIGVGIGSNLVSGEKLQNRQWEQITRDIQDLVAFAGKEKAHENNQC